jgi:hypothetical protein
MQKEYLEVQTVRPWSFLTSSDPLAFLVNLPKDEDFQGLVDHKTADLIFCGISSIMLKMMLKWNKDNAKQPFLLHNGVAW